MVSQEKQCLCCKWQAYLTTTGSISILPPQSLNSSEPLLCTCISAATRLAPMFPSSTVDWTFGHRGRNVTKFPHRFLFLFISWFLWLQFQCQTKWLSDFPSVNFILGASLNWSVLLWDRCKPASSSLKRLNLSAFCCLSHFAKLHAANGNSLFKESCKKTFCVFVYS